MPQTTRLIFLRHGETTWNAEDRLQGQKDSPLSPLGWRQIRLAARKVAALKPDVIYSSDLSRAVAAAELVARKLKVPFASTPELRERNFGEWEGSTSAEVWRLCPIEAQAHRDDPANFRPPGGESRADVCRRIAAFIQPLLEKHSGRKVFISAHGGPIKAAICYALSCAPETWLRLDIDNASLTIIEQRDGKLFLAAMNDISHLERAAGPTLEEPEEKIE
jgi:broad specificity phosphatase PhoE